MDPKDSLKADAQWDQLVAKYRDMGEAITVSEGELGAIIALATMGIYQMIRTYTVKTEGENADAAEECEDRIDRLLRVFAQAKDGDSPDDITERATSFAGLVGVIIDQRFAQYHPLTPDDEYGVPPT